ncbi:hypothetical protein LK09_08030 [Microbacterium mangrovi]|uniref:Solute-binding protein family 5 domain-containing protein n=2 Tax=Microbacterium mangrovi TaxID=1348253 RepID=A0A0B2AB38_9MICO|nr:hypothetical protein LK09_08030 [Microbacterium mangrovi]
MISGGSEETLNPNKLVTGIDAARIQQVYESAYTFDNQGNPVPGIVDKATPSADGTSWTLHVREGVTFQDGTPLTAADIAWSYNYVLDEANGAYGRGDLLSAGVSSVRAVDSSTVKVSLSAPNFMLTFILPRTQLAIFKNHAVPGANGKFIGTGPFKLERFVAGERAVFRAYPGYWGGAVNLDGVEIISLADPSALASAIQSGQILAAASVGYELVGTFKNNPQFHLFNGRSGYFNAFVMDTQKAPYNDPRVRKALRLLVDRKQQVTNALSGEGAVANDLFSWYDPYYASDIEQIKYDPKQAKALLEEAGVASQTFELFTTDGSPGMVAAASLFSASAESAGVDVKITKLPYDSYIAIAYGQKPFWSTYWPGLPLVQMWASTLSPNAQYPETHWHNAQWNELFTKALAAPNEGNRKRLMAEAQQVLHEGTGYIIPTFNNQSDVIRSSVGGIKEGPMDPFGGYDFRTAWLKH